MLGINDYGGVAILLFLALQGPSTLSTSANRMRTGAAALLAAIPNWVGRRQLRS